MEQEIIDLLHSEDTDDVKLGVEIMHVKHPDLFIYTDAGESSAWFIPGVMRECINVDTMSIKSLSLISDYCEENNYYKIKGQ